MDKRGRGGVWRHSGLYIALLLAMAFSGIAAALPIPTKASTSALPGQVPGCLFEKADAPLNVAFCDTFNAPAGIGNRSGDLNGTLWGVSRSTDLVNPGQGEWSDWYPTNTQRCGGAKVYPDQDVRICNGQVVDAVNDGANDVQTLLAMYPKQPFDIAGRTGTAVFDVGDNTQGGHAAWPEWWYTDQPVPTPHGEELPGIATTPRNGFGFSMAAICNQSSNQSCYPTNGCPNVDDVSIDSMTTVSNYVAHDTPFTQDGCVKEPTSAGQLNHFEVRISQQGVSVYGTDAGTTTPLKLLAHATFASPLPLTRGLTWMEDAHYNACKFNSQCDHSFTWDNFGFDGPTLPRDLAFDVPEAKIMQGDGTMQLGWDAPASKTSPLALTIPNVSGMSRASGALLTLTFGAQEPNTAISYSLNGSAWQTQPWVYDQTGYNERTIAIPIPLSEVVTGNNTLRLAANTDTLVANIDLILVGAGGGGVQGTPVPPPTVGAKPSATPTKASATRTPTRVPATPRPSATATRGPLPTPRPTVRPTAPPTGSGTVRIVHDGITPVHVVAGKPAVLTMTVVSGSTLSGVHLDYEVYGQRGTTWVRVLQSVRSGVTLTAGKTRTARVRWSVPTTLPAGHYVLKTGVFNATWTKVYAFDGTGVGFTVVAP